MAFCRRDDLGRLPVGGLGGGEGDDTPALGLCWFAM